MEALAKKLQGKLQFAFIYAQEMHPNQDILALPGSPVDSIPFLTPTLNRDQREQRAQDFHRLMNGGVRRMLVDEDGNGEEGFTKVQRLYHATTGGARNFVIDRDGHVIAMAKFDLLCQRLPELFPDVAPLLQKDGDNPCSADLPAED